MDVSPRQQPTERRDLVIAGAIALIGVLVFSLQIFSLQQQSLQFSKYPTAALQYIGDTIAPERILDFSPLYLGLHIIAFRFLENPANAVLWMHIVLLSFASALTYLILRRNAGRVLCLAGTSALMLSKSVVIFGYIFEPEPLMLFLLVAFVFFADRGGTLSTVAAGLSLTLCLLTRPSFLPLVILVPLYRILQHRRLRPALPGIMLFLLPVIAGFIFIGVRNFRLQGQLSLWFMSPGTVFFDSNNPLSDGTRAAYPPVINDLADQYRGESDYEHAIYRQTARRVAGKDLTPAEANSFWAAKATAYLSDHPGRFLLLTARRIFTIAHSYRWYDLATAWSADQSLERNNTPYFPFAPISALALLGLVVASSSWKKHFLPYAVFANQACVMALTYATDRQRVSLYPFFIFFAVLAVSWWTTEERRRRKLIAVAACVPLIFILSLQNDRMRDDRHLWEGIARTELLLPEIMQARDAGDHAAALEKASRAIALSPWMIGSGRPAGIHGSTGRMLAGALDALPVLREDTVSAQFDRALLLIEIGRLDEAKGILTVLAREGRWFDPLNGRNPDPRYHLGRIAYLQGQDNEAIRHLREAFRQAPGAPEVLAALSCLSGEELFAVRLFRYYDDASAHFFLGRACLDSGRRQKAVEHLSRVVSLLPDYVRGKIYLAAALGALGRDREAAMLYLSTAGDRPPLVILEDHIIPVFERRAREGSPESWYWYGIILRQYGSFDTALPALRKAARSGHPGAREEYRRLQDAIVRPGTPIPAF